MCDGSMSESKATQYFTTFLADKLNQELLPGLRRLSVSFHIHLTDWETAYWRLTLTGGHLTKIIQGEGVSECGFSLSGCVFAEIAAGRLSPQQAFFRRQISIEGNLVLGLRLATVLADFFRQYPYEMAEL